MNDAPRPEWLAQRWHDTDHGVHELLHTRVHPAPDGGNSYTAVCVCGSYTSREADSIEAAQRAHSQHASAIRRRAGSHWDAVRASPCFCCCASCNPATSNRPNPYWTVAQTSLTRGRAHE
jgi:hypothetical protein